MNKPIPKVGDILTNTSSPNYPQEGCYEVVGVSDTEITIKLWGRYEKERALAFGHGEIFIWSIVDGYLKWGKIVPQIPDIIREVLDEG